MSHSFENINPAQLEWKKGRPYSITFDDFYFTEQGIEESTYRFIKANHLLERWQNISVSENPHFLIAETGFGTGLNFLLTWHLWRKNAPSDAKLFYFSCEKHPIVLEDLKKIFSLLPQFKNETELLLENYPTLTPGFHFLSFENGSVNLILMVGDPLKNYRQLLVCGDSQLETELNLHPVDAWFLNGFSADKYDSTWSLDFFKIMNLLSSPVTSYSATIASNQVKDTLQEAGFTVQSKKGTYPRAKILYGQFSTPIAFSRPRCTPWHIASSPKISEKKAIIVGAGLAGCFTANALARRGWKVTVIDKEAKPGLGASGNRQAILYPKLSAFRSPLTEFMLSAYLFARQYYKKTLHNNLGKLTGMLQVAFNEKELAAQNHLREWLLRYQDIGALVDSEEGSKLAGIPGGSF